MKRSPRPRKSPLGVSLFPFLAVLICTMGALIVLLVLVVQQARVSAEETVVHEPTEAQRELEAQRDEILVRTDSLMQQRQGLTEDLSERRLRLAHLEDHLRQLHEQWRQLQDQQAELARLVDGEASNSESQQEIEQLKLAIREARTQLDQLRQELKARPRSFAIVPYQGPQGTRRRPIFIECTEEGVRIQPEGILLTAEDFGEPLGPGNPLDASLRAIREHWKRSETVAGEPYPLIVVRPSGVYAYAAVRAALKAWDDEFGYELINESMPLKYPPSDTALKSIVQQTIVEARKRQEIRRAAMPNRYKSDTPVGFVASSRGGFVPVDSAERPSRNRGFGTGIDERFNTGFSDKAAPADQNPSQQFEHGSHDQGVEGGRMGATTGQGVAPLAGQRGANWALPDSHRSATVVTRPLRIYCAQDRLVILPDSGEPLRIELTGPLQRHVDELLTQVWEEVERWDLAVVGGYWRPILTIEVARDGEQRFQELRVLLEGSGLQVTRK